MTIFDSASALQRFRSRHNLQWSSPNHVSSYILICKIKKALNQDLTDELAGGKRAEKISQFIIRLEKLDTINMKIIYDEYLENGIAAMVKMLSLPIAKLNRLTTELRRHEKEMY